MRYSDRERAASGTLDPLDYSTVPETLRTAILSIYQEACTPQHIGWQFDTCFTAALTQHFGLKFNSQRSDYHNFPRWLRTNYTDVSRVLDSLEIMVEEATRAWVFTVNGSRVSQTADAMIESRLNAAFVRHRLGYAFEGGAVRRVGSPALDEAVVGPALLNTARPGWEEVDRSFRAALHHRRGGPEERDAAITDAHAALEAALKAAGMSGDRLSALAKSFRNSGLVLPQLEGVPEALDMLLKRSSSVRDSLGDVHGKAPGADPVPDGVVDLAIYWTGAFINYLSAATSI